MEAVALSEDLSDSTQRSDSDSNRQIYFIPYSWWRDAQDSVLGDSDGKRGILYVTSQTSSYAGPMKIINNIFNSNLVFNLKREEDTVHSGENGEVGVSGRDYALVPTEMWVQALRWHSDSKAAVKDGKCFSAAEDDMTDVYPLQLRLSAPRETNSLGVRITKKDNAVEFFKRACKIFSVESEMRLCLRQTSLSQTSSPSAFLSLILSDRGSFCANPLYAKPHLRQTSLSTAPLSIASSLSRRHHRSDYLLFFFFSPFESLANSICLKFADSAQQFAATSSFYVAVFFSVGMIRNSQIFFSSPFESLLCCQV
ncbi:hypothetical protein GBA52_018164 [Prunus armeniaca]|nr:hypothetical protein GBA52_018164 [Prunus armeniaca]